MITKKGTVRNVYGIHCRPSGVIKKSVDGYAGKITIMGPDGAVANPHSVLSLLALALTNGDVVTVTVDGPDEESVCNRLIELFESTYEFQR